MLGSLHPTADGKYVLRFELHLAQSREIVWHALTQPEPRSCWFPARVEFEPRAGAPLRFKPTKVQIEKFGIPADQVGTGEVLQANPPALLEYSWGDEVLRWELTEDPSGGTTLVFANTIIDASDAPAIAAAWHAGLEIVKSQLDGTKPESSMWERAEELTSDYATTMR
jgi:uncharacterized protein YndB with AHSA1/START domain